MKTQPWWQTVAVYQIYPRSFADSDGDGVGDLRGAIARLPYLADLGVGAIWLSPVFESPMADFGYDISDHRAIDPLFGTLEDAQRLIDEAHAAGLRVLFDIVLGHTSDRHAWFVSSASSRTSPHRDWYVWRDGPTPGRPDGGPPNNWQAGFPPGASTWTWSARTAQWYLHSHLPEQPDLDWTNPEVRAAQLDVARFWLDRGVDGLRLDSINRLGKDPALRDNVPDEPLRQQDWPSVHEHLREVRKVVDEYPDRMVVGEVWEFDQRDLVTYLAPDELQLAHNFVFARLPFEAAAFATTVAEFVALAPDAWPAWFLNNHDEPRTVSRWRTDGDDDATAAKRGRVAASVLLTLRGTPFLYQGEELGLPDTDLPAEVRTDPNGRDPQRTPMPWEPPSRADPSAGFTDGTPWLPIDPHSDTLNVRTESADPASMLTLYRDLLALRRALPPLTGGSLEHVGHDGDVLRYVRRDGDSAVLVLANFADRTCSADVAGLVPSDATARIRWSSEPVDGRTVDDGTVELRPLEAMVCVVSGAVPVSSASRTT